MQAPKLMAILAVLAPLSGLALQDEAAKASDAARRIAGRVMADTEAGRTTEALVILREQADLRPAASLPTKAAKGRFVLGRRHDHEQRHRLLQ